MKMRLTILFAMLAAFAVLLAGCGSGGGGALPQGGSPSNAVYPLYVDSNGNSVNDYVEPYGHDPHPYHDYVDANGDGVCDYAQDGSPTWHGPGYVDADTDGVCDYWDESSAMHGVHTGLHYHDGNGDGMNDYAEEPWHDPHPYHAFTDVNADGICDYAQDGSSTWHGPGYVDDNGDGVCDYWQPGGMGYGDMHGGGGPMM